jgi:hypothetical protein
VTLDTDLASVRKKVEALNAFIAVPLDKAYFQALSRKFGERSSLAKSGLNLKADADIGQK